MKSIIYYLFPLLVVFYSCERYDEVHKEYIVGGEIVYSIKPDCVYVQAGLNRCRVNVLVDPLPNTEKLAITWEDGISETDIAEGSDSVFMDIDLQEMTEGSVIFTITTVDVDGNESVPILAFSNIYGEDYQSKLLNRPILEISSTDTSAIVQLGANPETAIGIDITYMDTTGNEQQLYIPSSDNSSFSIENIKHGSELSYVTYYLPEENCLDSIPTAEAKTVVVPE